MELKIHNRSKGNIAELTSQLVLENVQDFLDLIGNANYLQSDKLIINQNNVKPDFFDLKTKIAGEILQKFSTYNQKLAIIGDYAEIESKSLRDFIRESNRIGRILFVKDLAEAIEKLDN